MSIPLLTGKIYPDKTFSIGFIPREKKGKEKKRYDSGYEEKFDSYLEIERSDKDTTVKEERFFDHSVVPDRFIKSAESSQTSRKYGRKGITRYGRKNVSGISTLLQERYGKERLGFGTSTLPSLTYEGSLKACELWGEIVRRFFQSLKRYFEAKGKKFLYVSCTEIQEKRLLGTGIACPHLHFVYVCRRSKRSGFYINAQEMRQFWERAVIQVIGCQSLSCYQPETTFRASIDCQIVKKSASGYLGKYLSKGSNVIASMQKKGYEKFPRQWWSASMQCKKAFKKSIIRLDSNLCRDIFYSLGEYLADGFITWFMFVEIPIAGEMRTVGITGVVSNEAYTNMKNVENPWLELTET